MTGTKTAFEDIAKLVLMESPANGSVLAVKLRKEKSLDHAALMKVAGATEGRANSKSYVRLRQGFVCCINGRTFVATQTEAAMQAILTRETQEVQLGEDMKFLASRAGRSGQIYLAVGSGSTPAGNAGKAVVGDVMMLKSFGSDGRGIIAFASPSLDAVDLGLGILYTGRAAAQASMKSSDRAIFDIRDKLEQNANALSAAGYGRAAFIKEVMEKIETSSDGELVVTRSTVPMKFFEPLVSQLVGSNNAGSTMPMPKAAPKVVPK